MTLDEILQQYAGLLIIQYRTKTKAISTIKLLVNQSLCEGLPLQLQSCFNLDTALGAQLTILGKIVGVPRNVQGCDIGYSFFNFVDAGNVQSSIGFADAAVADTTGYLFYSASMYYTYALSDADMAVVIKLKIIKNSKAMTMKAVKEALYAYFAGDIDIIPTTDASNSYFNFTNADGVPASSGFGSASASPYPSGYPFYDSTIYVPMLLTYNAKSKYQKAIGVAQFLDAMPRPMGAGVQINYQ